MSIKSEYRKTLVIRGFQMLVIGFIFNLGVTIIGLLALIQFFWMLFAKEKNKTQISKSPEDSANSITKSILKGIRLEN